MAVSATRSAAARAAWVTIRAKQNKTVAPPKPRPKLEPLGRIVLPKAQYASAKDMMLKTVVMVLTISGIGNRRKVDTSSLNITDARTEEDVNKEWIGVTKKLMNAPELQAITGIQNKARAYVISRALPSQIKIGVYLLSKELTDGVDERLKEFQAELGPHIESLARNLPKYKREAQEQQGAQFNEKQFPTADEVRGAFDLSWRYLHVDSAAGLSKKLYEEERVKAEASWRETRETITALLRGQLAEMVNHLVEKLQPAAPGEKKIFREGSIEKLHDFLATFDARNITNDAQMKVLVDNAKRILNGTDVEMLRNDSIVRNHVRKGFETIQTLLEPMIANAPHRRIIVD